MSGGRAGWNVVTSSDVSEAWNYGLDAPLPHDSRYESAMEFSNVVKGLLDSWDDDVFIRDRGSAIYFNSDSSPGAAEQAG